MSTPRIRLGQIGEGLARRHLESRGYAIVAANVRNTSGEIDLVAEHKDVQPNGCKSPAE